MANFGKIFFFFFLINGKICIQGICSFHGERVKHHFHNMYNMRPFLKSYDELGGQFENLLRFLEMGTATTPPTSLVTNDQPLKKTNRILHNLAAFYQKSIFGGINSETKQIKLVTTTA